MAGSARRRFWTRGLLLHLVIITVCTNLCSCNSSASGSGGMLLNPVSDLVLEANVSVSTLIVSWSDSESLFTTAYRLNYTADVMDTVIASDSVLINDNCSADNIMYSLMEPFVQSGVTITVSVEASITDDYYCDPVFNMTVIDGEFSPSPTSLAISNSTSSSLILSWTILYPVVPPTSFSLFYTIDKLSGAPPANTNTTLSIALNDSDLTTDANGGNYSLFIQGLTSYSVYSFSLSSVYANITSGVVTASADTSEGMSDPVEGLAANITGADLPFSITMLWSSPSEPNGVILHYSYTIVDADTSVSIDSNITNETSIVGLTLTELLPYTNYTVTVIPVNGAGDGENSSTTALSPQTPPGQVGGLQASFSATGAMFAPSTRIYTLDMTVTWNEPTNPNGVITTYSVTVHQTANSSNVVYNNESLTDLNVTESVMVLPFTDYTVSVSASTSAGQGEETTTIITSPEAEPGPVRNLNASFSDGFERDLVTQVLNLSLTIEWDEPEFPNGLVLNYTVTVYQTANPSDVVYSNDSITDLNVTESVMVLPFTNYTVSVSASTSAGQGDETMTTITSPEAVPGKVEDLDAVFNSSGLIFDPVARLLTLDFEISWNEPTITNGEILAYEVNVTQTDNSSYVVYSDSLLVPNITVYVILVPYTNYTVTVAASTSAGQGESTNITRLSPEAMPGPIINLNASFVDASIDSVYNSATGMLSLSVEIEWDEPMFPNGVLMDYTVTVYQTENSSNVVYSDDSIAGLTVTAESVMVLPYTNYTVSVSASTSAGQGEETTTIITSPEARPGEVDGLVATFSPSTTFNSSTRMHTLNISIMWSKPITPNGAITGYSVTVYQTANSSDVVYSNDSITDLNVTESVMVLPFTDYTVSVSASTSAGQGDEATFSVESPQAEPSPVNGLTASFSEQTTFNSTTRVLTVDIDISWSLPTFQNGMVTFYEVTVFEEGTNTLVYSNNSITNLTESVMVLPFTDYTVSVSASTSAGQGDETTVTVESPQAEPGQVVGLMSYFDETETEFAPDSRMITIDLIVTWHEPQYPNGIITVYEFRLIQTKTGGEVFSDDSLVVPNVTESVMVLPFTNYTVSVSASTSAGQGDETTFTVESPQAVPGSVRGLNASFDSTGSSQFDSLTRMYTLDISIMWNVPMFSNGIITGYNVTVYQTDDPGDVVYSNNGITDLNVTAESVMVLPYTDYTVSVSASTSAGQGDETTTIITSPEAAPSVVTNLDAEFGPSTFFDPDSRLHTLNISISWDTPVNLNGVIVSYQVNVTNTEFDTEVYSDINVADLNVTESVMVLPFTDYTVSVTASTSAGQGEEVFVVIVSPQAAPGPVENLVASFLVPGVFDSSSRMYTIDINITWDEPIYPNGVITAYNVTVYQTANSSDVVYRDGSITNLTVTESVMVLPFTDYTVSVSASTSAGQGDETTVTVESPQAEPGPVENLVASFNESGAVFVSATQTYTINVDILWDIPTYPNGVVIAYTVMVYQSGDSEDVVYSGSVTDLNVTESVMVLPFTNYTVSVSASTSAGQGDETTTIILSPEAAPTAPRDVTAVALSPNSIRVSWSPPQPANGVITGYRITYYVTSDGESQSMAETVEANVLFLDITDLIPHTQYTVYVEANTTEFGDKSNNVNVTTAQTAPTEPTNLVATAISSSEISVTWDEPATTNGIITGYTISHSLSGTLIDTITAAADMMTVNIADLDPFTTYDISVVAITVVAGPPATTSVRTEQAAPTAPRNLMVVAVTAFNVTIQWEEPDPTNGIITNYIIQYYQESSPNTVNDSVQGTSVVVDGLRAFTTYVFRVSAETVAEGPYTETDPTRTAESTPSPPQNVTARNLSSTSIEVEWSPPDTPQGIITSYSVTYYITSDGEGSSEPVMTDGNTINQSIQGLMKFTEYSVYVEASTSVGVGDRSEVATVVTDEDVPSAPQNLMLNVTGPTSVIASWSTPAAPNGILLHYNVYLEREEEGQLVLTKEGEVEAIQGEDSYSFAFDDLLAFSLYEIRVSAETRIGKGPDVNRFITTDPDSASPPSFIDAEALSSTSIRLSWGYPEIPRGNITGYLIMTNAVPGGQLNITLESINDMSNQTYDFGGLLPFTDYFFLVGAVAETEEQTHYGNLSQRIVIQTNEDRPSVPLGFMLEAVASKPTELLASWSEPQPPNGVITGYTLTCTRSTNQYYPEQVISEPPVVTTADGGDRHLTVTGLKPFTNYGCSLTASTSVGEGPPTDTMTQATVESAPSGAPRNFSAEALSSSSIELSWIRPATPNGVITSYSIQYYTTAGDDDSEPVSMTINDATITSRTVENLNEYTNYTFIISAATSVGSGPEVMRTETTDEDVPSAGVVELEGVNSSSTSLYISWQPPPVEDQNGVIQGYTISYGLTTQDPSQYATETTEELNITLEPLERFTYYTVVVRPFTVVGSGPEESVTVQTDSDLPSKPVNLSYINITAASIELFWQPPLQPNGILEYYTVMYKDLVTGETLSIDGIGPQNLSVVIEPLEEFHEYEMMVAASTDKGFGPCSTPLYVHTDEHEPDAPENFMVVSINSTTVLATWDEPLDPNGIIISYSLTLSLARGWDYLPHPDTSSYPDLGPEIFELEIPGLHPYAEYVFTLNAATSVGPGNITDRFIITEEAAPSQGVQDVFSSVLSSTEIKLFWLPPDLVNWNGILTNYTIDVMAVNDCNQSEQSTLLPTSYRITIPTTNLNTPPDPTDAYSSGGGVLQLESTIVSILEGSPLEEYQSYVFSVRVWNREGGAPVNDNITSCNITQEAAPSGPPNITSFNITSNTTASLAWYPPPPLERNGVIVGYNVTLCSHRTGRCDSLNTGSSDEFFMLTDLTPFTSYNVTVSALTSEGQGPSSESVTDTTLEGLPTMPVNLTVVNYDHNFIYLSWSPPETSYGNLEGYRIVYQGFKQDIDEVSMCDITEGHDLTTTMLSINLTGLVGDSQYCIEVSARTGAGYGSVSTVVQILPVGPPPMIDPEVDSGVVPRPVVDPNTGDDGISDTSANIMFTLPPEINMNGPVDRVVVYAQRMPSDNQTKGTWYESSISQSNWPQYAALSMGIDDQSSSKRARRQDDGIEVEFTIGDSTMTCTPSDVICNGPLDPNALYGVRYTLFSGDQSQEFPFFPMAQFKTDKSPSEASSDDVGVIAGGVVGAILSLVAVGGVGLFTLYYCFFKARRKGSLDIAHRTSTGDKPLLPIKNGSTKKSAPFLRPSDPCIVPLGETKSNTAGISKSRSPSKKVHSRRIMLKELGESVRGMLGDAGYIFSEEYERVTEVGLEHNKEASLMTENRAKNRYTNILAYDHSRVKLSYVDDDPGSDYINASYIPGYHMRRAYIATQGPLPATFDDFWRMVWEQNTHTIVMLTQLVERGRTKCHRYWPGAECIVYGEIAVEMLSEKELDDWTVREFKLSMEKNERIVCHYQFTSWPDHGVPETPTAAIDFVGTVRESVLMNHGPLVVHCSAGVGRTGCFIALDTLLQHIEEHDYIDVFGLASEMRQHRNHMIQTEAQYVFVHKAMVEYINSHYSGKSPTKFSNFSSLYANQFTAELEDSTQMTDYYGDFLSEETHM